MKQSINFKSTFLTLIILLIGTLFMTTEMVAQTSGSNNTKGNAEAEKTLLKLRKMTQEGIYIKGYPNLPWIVADELMLPLRNFVNEHPKADAKDVIKKACQLIQDIIGKYPTNQVYQEYFSKLHGKIGC